MLERPNQDAPAPEGVIQMRWSTRGLVVQRGLVKACQRDSARALRRQRAREKALEALEAPPEAQKIQKDSCARGRNLKLLEH